MEKLRHKEVKSVFVLKLLGVRSKNPTGAHLAIKQCPAEPVPMVVSHPILGFLQATDLCL